MPISPISPSGPEPIRPTRAVTRRKPTASESEEQSDEVLISSVETADAVDPPHKQNETDDHTGKGTHAEQLPSQQHPRADDDRPHIDIQG
ncbi:MAG: hypothetical protein H6815_13840 [Phycisphaeraceae bacterium]|nr:hypothetical protein [Phycisphaerales bacterium]MCB9861521.1 hypothetical protein [Phycisphaeraceae bacterium]